MIGTDGSRQKLRHEQNGAMLMCLGQKAYWIRFFLMLTRINSFFFLSVERIFFLGNEIRII